MKTRIGFVSNSSSTSFIITNKTKTIKTLLDFVEENPHLVKEFNEEYDWHDYTQKQMIENAKHRIESEDDTAKIRPGKNKLIFGDEDGDALGAVFDYILRDGGHSENFKWKFDEYYR